MIHLSVPLRAGAAVLVLGAAQLTAQLDNFSGVWALEPRGFPVLFDERGVPIRRYPSVAGLERPARLALDGALWAVHPGNLELLRMTGAATVQQHLFVNETPLAVVSDRQAHGLVLLSSRRLAEFDTNLTQLATHTLPLAPVELEVDGSGIVWIGFDNQPAALLGRFDRATGSMSLVQLPAALGSIVDILPDGRAGGSHVYVCGDNSAAVAEVDPTPALVATHQADPQQNRPLRALELAPDGAVWATNAFGIWRIEDSGRVTTVAEADSAVTSPLGSPWVAFANEGRAWIFAVSGRATLLDGRTTELLGQVPGTPSVGTEDASGTYLMQVVDPGGDHDGDGTTNANEVRIGSDPFDAQSSSRVDLDTGVEALAGEKLAITLHGTPGAALVVASSPATPRVALPVPGVIGELRLDPNQLLPGGMLVAVPGRLELPVPAALSRVASLAFQAVHVPFFGGTPAFSDAPHTQARPGADANVDLRFDDAAARDDLRSGGPWVGGMKPADAGGRGVLGSFDHTLGRQIAPDVWEFSTDVQLFPAGTTLFGPRITVNDGVFEFTDFVIPAGVEVRFRGANPAFVRVRGRIAIDGTLSVAGDSVSGPFDGSAAPGSTQGRAGQSGAVGGPGGSAGGSGGRGCDGQGVQPVFRGVPGRPLLPPAVSGYAGLPGLPTTGGRGGNVFPADGLNASIVFNLFNTLTGMEAAGGGGGGFVAAGAPGRAVSAFTGVSSDLGPNTPGGVAVGFVTPPAGTGSRDHFLVGGSGGGGGGSCPVNMSRNQIGANIPWHAGGGGAGGGGALALVAGGGFRVAAQGRIAAVGGSGGEYFDIQTGPPVPGGGGSGGSVLIQVGSMTLISQQGEIDISGGAGGVHRFRQVTGNFGDSRGGDGGHGLVRLEAPSAPTLVDLGTVRGPATLPPESVGVLGDDDVASGQQSAWLPLRSSSGQVTPATPRHYVITGTANAQSFRFSDDPAAFHPANLPGQPLRFFVQGAEHDLNGEIVRVGRWRDVFGGPAGIAADGTTDAVRFMVLFDRSVATDTVIDRVLLRADG